MRRQQPVVAMQLGPALDQQVETVGVDDMVARAEVLKGPAIIYLELPTNPLLRVVDFEAGRLASPVDTTIIVDATLRRRSTPNRLPEGSTLWCIQPPSI